jgi:AcrR family transcriptional regulator
MIRVVLNNAAGNQTAIRKKMASTIHRPHLSTAQDPRAIRTREALRAALLKLLEQKPLDQITIRDIAGTAGIGYVTFFRHHPTKEALLHEIAAEQVRQLIVLMLPALQARDVRTASVALCTHVNHHRKLWSTLLTGGAAAVLRETLLTMAGEVSAIRPNPKSWLPAELAITFNVTCTIELLTWWLRQKRPLTIERVAEIHERIIVTPTMEADRSLPRRAVAKKK